MARYRADDYRRLFGRPRRYVNDSKRNRKFITQAKQDVVNRGGIRAIMRIKDRNKVWWDAEISDIRYEVKVYYK